MLNPVAWYVEAAQRWAWKGVTVLALATSALALFVVYTEAPAEIGIPLPESVNVVPASGPQGFPVEVFCDDPDTTVTVTLTPEGLSYEALRTKDDVPELVLWVTGVSENNPLATRYYRNDTGEQLSELATVSAKAAECLREKAQ